MSVATNVLWESQHFHQVHCQLLTPLTVARIPAATSYSSPQQFSCLNKLLLLCCTPIYSCWSPCWLEHRTCFNILFAEHIKQFGVLTWPQGKRFAGLDRTSQTSTKWLSGPGLDPTIARPPVNQDIFPCYDTKRMPSKTGSEPCAKVLGTIPNLLCHGPPHPPYLIFYSDTCLLFCNKI